MNMLNQRKRRLFPEPKSLGIERLRDPPIECWSRTPTPGTWARTSPARRTSSLRIGPEGVGGYRRHCDEVSAKGYEGFEFASQGQGGTARTMAAE
jgi:hypothetical protein